uniref:Uncharacterized protein n=1 Tax=Rhizophora mucronata TaxID=61149 RepID=A0A2P2Q3J4_RHIMU
MVSHHNMTTVEVQLNLRWVAFDQIL